MTRIQRPHFTYNAVVSFNAYHENKLSQYHRDCQILVKCSCARAGSAIETYNKFHIGSYMSVQVLFNLLNEFNKFNNTGERLLDSIYHMTSKLLKHHIFGVKMSRFWFIEFIVWRYLTPRRNVM